MRQFFLIGCSILVSWALHAREIPFCKEEPFQAGERIEMAILYKWGAINTEVAQASMVLEQEENGYHATMAARTAPFFDVFYRIRENFQSRFSLKGFRPMEAIRDTYENGYTATNHYIYDWDAGIIRAELSFRGSAPECKEIPLKSLSFDMVTLVYYIRNLDWGMVEAGQVCQLPFAIDNDVFNISITCRGQENLKVRRMGRFRAMRLSCSVVAGVLFEGDQEIQVWFSDDDNHLPLAVMVPLKMGTMWAWLKRCENLKNPITAKL